MQRTRLWLAAGAFAVWAASRAYYVLLYTGVLRYEPLAGVFQDVLTYHRWMADLTNWQMPLDDPTWQYPPGAAPIFLIPRLFSGTSPDQYTDLYFALTFVADLAILVTLAVLARKDGSLFGVWSWAAVVPLLGMVTYARYDIFVAAAAVVALAATVRRPAVAGALMAIGALIKVWPAMLLITAKPFRGLRPMLIGFTAGLVVVGGGLSLLFANSWGGFTGNQADRGLQVEAVAATPLVLGRLWNDSLQVVPGWGALEFAGPYVDTLTALCPLLTVVGLGVLGLWWLVRGRRLRWSATVGFDVALTAVLVAVVTSRVFSPQYLLWLLALVGACLSRRDTSQRLTSVLVIISTALTGWLFPWHYNDVIGTANPYGITLLVVRNVLVAAAVIASFVTLYRAGEKEIREARSDTAADLTAATEGTGTAPTSERPTPTTGIAPGATPDRTITAPA